MAYDDALALFHTTNPEFTAYGTDRLANHGPMAAHALHALGLDGSIAAFTDRYMARLRPLEQDNGAAAHIDAYAGALEERGWVRVLQRELPELIWGLSAGALHGLLRVTHAARALAKEVTPNRLTELAHGLSFWKARYVRLPGEVGATPTIPLDGFLRGVPLVQERIDGLIVDRMLRVETLPAFARHVEQLSLPATPSDTTTLLTTFAAERICETESPRARFAYLHGLTGASCLRVLSPLAAPADLLPLQHAVVQAIAALDSVTRESTPSPWNGSTLSRDALRDHAANCEHDGHDHHIKIIEAVLREYEAEPREVLLRAASRLIA